jgi:tetratricopeptide (TPR) repeat protein
LTVAFAIITSVLLYQESIARSNAENARDQEKLARGEADAANRFLGDVVGLSKPEGLGLGRDAKLAQALDWAIPQIDERFANMPRAESSVRHAIGEGYRVLGQHEKAEPLLDKAYQLSIAHRGSLDPETLEIANSLALCRMERRPIGEAEQFVQERYHAAREQWGEAHPSVLQLKQALGLIYSRQNKFELAEKTWRECLPLQHEILGSRHQETLRTMGSLGTVLRESGRREKITEAAELHEVCYKARLEKWGERHPDTITSMNNLAEALDAAGHRPEAMDLNSRCVPLAVEVLGRAHPTTVIVRANRAVYVAQESRDRRSLDVAVKLLREVVADAIEIRLTDDRTVLLQRNLATCLVMLDSYVVIEEELLTAMLNVRFPIRLNTEFLREAEELTKTVLGKQESKLFADDRDNVEIGHTCALLGTIILESGRPKDAEPFVERGFSIRQKKLDPSDWRLAASMSAQGACYAGQGRFQEAEPILTKAYNDLNERKNPAPELVRRTALKRIIALYEAWGRSGQASDWRMKLQSNKK